MRDQSAYKGAPIGIGLAGYGMIGRLHTMGYYQIPFIYPDRGLHPAGRAVMTSSRVSARTAAREGSFTRAYTDLEQLCGDPSVDVIDISLPNHLHRDAAEAAVRAGKHIYCEKPLAGNLKDAREICRIVTQSGLKFGMVFQYRFIPAVIRAKELITVGKLGRVFSFRAEYLHSGYQDPGRPLNWRMKKDEGGSGALGDLGSHVIDLMRFLLGEFSQVQCHLETFIKERPLEKGSLQRGSVTVDDAAWLQVKLENGTIGTIEASRFAVGTMDDLRFWIYGEKGSVHFSLMDLNFLHWFDGESPSEEGWKLIQTAQHYPGAAAPPGRAPMGWERSHIENQFQFLASVVENREPTPGILDGLRTQLVLDAAEQSSLDGDCWKEVEQY